MARRWDRLWLEFTKYRRKTLWSYEGRSATVALLFVPADLWIGVFVEHLFIRPRHWRTPFRCCFYLCPFPSLVLRVRASVENDRNDREEIG